MKVNWKVRFKNKAWLTSFFAAILTFVYTMLGMFDIYPEVTKNDVGEIVSSVLMFLSLMGIIVDPTTAGLNDSSRAMGYEEPYEDHPESDNIPEVNEGDQEYETVTEETITHEVVVETENPDAEINITLEPVDVDTDESES